MSTITATISGVSYPVHLLSGWQITSTYEMRDIFTFTIVDSPGTAVFQRGQPVTFSDSVSGSLYVGYVAHDKPDKLSPDPNSTTLLHTITCMDLQYLVDKRSNDQNYENWYAGDIVSNITGSILSVEGVGITAAMRYDNSQSAFSGGNLSGTVASTAIPTNTGDLELAKAGNDLTVTENTTANFASGTLTNVTATNNTLVPTTVSGMQVTATLPTTQSTANLNIFYWTGSQALGTNDTWNYDIWISSTSPQIMAASYFLFTDGSISGGMVDSNGRSALSTDDASTYAKDTWYTRSCSTTTWNGKTISAVVFKFGGASQGTYTAYIKNAHLSSGPVFLATNATALQTSPPTVWTYLYYNPSSVIAQLVQLFDPATSSRVSPTYNLASVGLVKSSSISWNDSASPTPLVSVSYDGGTTYAQCTNKQALPALPAGSNVSSSTFVLKETFDPGSNPTAIPSLSTVNISVLSAPAATKSDIVTTYATQTALNTGTYASTQSTASGQLELNQVTRNWNDNLITNQTFFPTSSVTQSAATGAYVISCSSTGAATWGVSRLDFVGSMVDLTIDCDVTIANGAYATITYRQYYWSAADKTYGYAVSIYKDAGTSGLFILERGSNGDPGGTFSSLASITKTVTPGTAYHIKIVVSGTTHLAYFNNESTPSINVTDSTFVQAGGIGLRSLNNIGSGTTTGTFDNLVVSQAGFGTWTSPSVSISSLGTSGGSAISWEEQNTSNPVASSILVQSTVDGGSTYQTCVNGSAIPNIPAGTNLSGKSIKLLVTLSSIYPTQTPILSNLFWRVLGQYPGSSGTRTTLPLGYDLFARANQSGWGTAADTQTWAKTGTGTDAIASNTGTIANTTGNVFEVLGSHTATDQEAVVQVQLSASTIQGGIALRYVSSTKYYKLALSTTGLSIIKNTGSGESTLATASGTYATGTVYWLRFRVTGSGPNSLYGKVWLGDGSTVEPGIVNGVLSPITPAWTVTASD